MSVPSPLRPEFARLRKEYDAVVQCNRCGFCETACPTYVASGKETLSPRGRNQAFRQILEGKISDPARAGEIFSTCLTCHACTNVCFSQVPVGRLMASAREIARPEGRLEVWERVLYRFLLFHRRLLSLVLGTAFFFKRLGISRILKRAGILKRISPQLDAGETLLESVPLRFGTRPWNSPGARTAYFSACGIHYLYPQVSRAILEMLQRLSVPLQCPSHACCGMVPNSGGDTEGARRLARSLIRQFKALNPRRILVNDDSCAGFMKSYAALLPGDPDAASIASRVRNLSEFLVEKEGVLDILRERWNPQSGTRVTYHDPCQMGNGAGSVASPRTILKGLPGVEYVEMEDAGVCCGGAGTYCLKHPQLADEVLDEKLERIRKTGSSVVVTQASSCLLHIGYGLRKKVPEVRTVHMAEFLAENLSDIR